LLLYNIMSGQPNRNPTDADKYRQQYLANLGLRANIDDMDLQANKIYKKTGQTPTQPTDTRTTEEKYADIERLKIDLRAELQKNLMDGTEAESVVNQLAPDELLFASTFINALTSELKPKYKYGVPSSIFIPFLQRYMEREIRTRGVNNGLQQEAGANILLGVNQIIGRMITQNDLAEVLRRIDGIGGSNTGLIQAVRRDIDELKRVLPNIATLQQISSIENANLRFHIQQDLNLALQNLPTQTQLFNVLRAIETAQEARDGQALGVATQTLHQLLMQPPSTLDDIQALERTIIESIRRAGQGDFPGKVGELTFIDPTRLDTLSQAQLTAYIEGIMKAEPEILRGRMQLRGLKKTAYLKLPANDKIADLMAVDNELRILFKLPLVLEVVEAGGASYTPKKIPSKEGENIGGIGGVGIRGKGLGRSRKPAMSIDMSKGMAESTRFVPFGKYAIHNHKLADDIIMLRRPAGSAISSLPTERVSKRLGHIVRKIVGNGHPTYDELSELNGDEKDYLHNLVKSANIADRISVPSPNRDEEEKDINQFEIMKGEIMSGNDNVDLIKRFKVLIIKLTNKGLIPKGQSKDILMDLVSMGF